MKYKSCKYLEQGISFYSKSIHACCINSNDGGGSVCLKNNFDGISINWEDIRNKTKKFKEDAQKGVLPESCKNCCYLTERKWEKLDYYTDVMIGHWTECNCNCIYCYKEQDREKYEAEKKYKILPIIKEMIEKKLINKKTTINFGGGEPTVLEEFDDILNELLKAKIKDIRIHTNGIKHSKSIEKLLKQKKVKIITSIDAGCKETFQAIKKQDSYNTVWDNLKIYAKANNKNIKTKYVLFPGYNDNLTEINEWLQKTKEIGIKNIIFDIEDNWYKTHKNNLPLYIHTIFNYVMNTYPKYGIKSCELYERARHLKENKNNIEAKNSSITKKTNDVPVIYNDVTEYKSCLYLEQGLSFFSNSLHCCCYTTNEGGGQINLEKEFNGTGADWKKIRKRTETFRENAKKGIYPDGCLNCGFLQKKQWAQIPYYTELMLGHWTYCNCNCIYCYTEADKKAYNKLRSYNIYPVLKELYKNGLINSNTNINFGGGEPTILKEFDDLMEFFFRINTKSIRINSSGIKYSKQVEKALQKDILSLVISIDAGSEETYEKVKKVKHYKKVWENIKNYAKIEGGIVRTKFILIPGINDTFEEIDNWLKNTQHAGVKNIAFDVEDNWYKANINEETKKYVYNFYNYVKQEYPKYGIITCELYERLQQLEAERGISPT